MAALLLALLAIGHVQGAPPATLESIDCTGGLSQCMFTHSLSCNVTQDGERWIVFRYAFNGYLPTYNRCNFGNTCSVSAACCVYSPVSGEYCINDFSPDAFGHLSRDCLKQSSCTYISRSASTGQCGVAYRYTPIISIIGYSCIQVSLIVNTLSPKLLSRVTSASVLVEKLAFDPDMSHYATCVLSSISGRRQVDVSIVLYAHQITPAPQGNWNVTISDSRQILQVFHNGGRTNELMYPVKTPIIVDLYFERDGYPEILWIGFEAVSGTFTIECLPVIPADPITEILNPNSTIQPLINSTYDSHPAVTSAVVMNPYGYSELGSKGDNVEVGNNTGTIVGCVIGVLIAVLLVTVIAVFIFRRRSRSITMGAKPCQNILPACSSYDDEGYCVPVTSSSSDEANFTNCAYVISGVSVNECITAVYKNMNCVISSRLAPAKGTLSVANRCYNLETGTGNGANMTNLMANGDTFDSENIYENLAVKENEDAESGIDDEWSDSEFDEVGDSNALNTNFYGNVHDGLTASNLDPMNDLENDVIYYELEGTCPATSGVNFDHLPIHKTHSKGVEFSQRTNQAVTSFQPSLEDIHTQNKSIENVCTQGVAKANVSCTAVVSNGVTASTSAQKHSGKGNILHRVRQGAKDMKKRFYGLLPKPMTRTSNGSQSHVDVRASAMSSSCLINNSSGKNTVNYSTGHDCVGSNDNLEMTSSLDRGRLPRPSSNGRLNKKLPVTAALQCSINNSDDLYDLAKPIDAQEQDNFTLCSAAIKSENCVLNNQSLQKNLMLPNRRGRGGYENQMPGNIVEEIKKASNQLQPASPAQDVLWGRKDNYHGAGINDNLHSDVTSLQSSNSIARNGLGFKDDVVKDDKHVNPNLNDDIAQIYCTIDGTIEYVDC